MKRLSGCCVILIVALTLGFSLSTNRPAFAQEAPPEEVKQLPRVVVTGSYIPTAELVGPAPLETVTAADIERSGASDVRDLLKRVSPSFAGNGNVGQEVNNGGFGESNVQLRNLPTLVLINGHRLGNSSFSAFSGGVGLADLNTIPLAMIDHIEVLKDGASALYGSAAIGGVVNIITKSEYTGVDLSGRLGSATGKGTYTERGASLVTGAKTDDSSFLIAASFFQTDPLLSKNREIASLNLDQLLKLGSSGNVSYLSPSFAGKVQQGSTVYLLANSPFLALNPQTGQPHIGYNAGLTGGPNGTTPGSPPIAPGGPFTSVADYNAAAIANGYVDPTGNGLGPYVQVTSAELPDHGLLNTPLFGTHTIDSQDRRQFFAIGEHDLIGKQLQLFGQFIFANTESIGALAPSPVISLFDANIFVPADNVYNPFGIDLGPPGSNTNPRVRSRFIQSGNREFDAQTDFYHFVGGLKGEFEGGYTYNTAFTYNRYDQIEFTRNAINGAALDALLKPNPDPALAALGLSSQRDASGNFLPQYNIFFSPTEPFPTTMGPNPADVVNELKTTLFQSGLSQEWDADGVITGTPLELPGGKLGFAVGGGVRSESLAIDFDGLTKIGKVPGLNASDPTSGTRDSYSIFAELRVPLTSPDMNIPGLHRLEVNPAGRFESIDPGGDSLIPKITARWEPIDEQFALRGNYSQSFLAPSTFQLFGGAQENNPFLALTGDGSFAQHTTINRSNPDLKPVDAESWGGGIVFTPKAVPGLVVTVDYYHIKTRNDIFRFSEQGVINDLEVNGSNSRYRDLFRFDNGATLTSATANQITDANFGRLDVPWGNGASVETEGIDFLAGYKLPTDTFGTFNFWVTANYLLKFDYNDPVISGGSVALGGQPGPYPYDGQYTDRINGIGGAQGLLPRYQINTGLAWDIHDFTYTINARYIPEVQDRGTLHQSNIAFENTFDDGLNDFTDSGKVWTISDWFTIDMQLAYEFGKGQPLRRWYDGFRVAVGANNITDEKPPLVTSSFEDNTDKSTYDIIGRFVYFEVGKKF
jgi:iron complex outermembrane receptor protein